MKKVIKLEFQYIYTHSELIKLLEPTNSLVFIDYVTFKIDFTGRKVLYSDYLLLVALKINDLKEIGVTVEVEFINLNKESDAVKYASRMNFFKLIGHDLEENFTRNDGANKFVEITKFDKNNIVKVADEIMRVLLGKGLDQDLLTALNFCVYEVLDNSLNHSKGDFIEGSGLGFVSAQFFPLKSKFRMIIADCGVGIHHALTMHPKSKFKKLSEKEAIEQCIKKGVTNSMGRGFGLWGTSEMVKQNEGELFIHSGNHCLTATENSKVFKKSNWKGVFTYLQINTNKFINIESIFDEQTQIKRELFQEYKEGIVNEINHLW